MYVLLVQEVPKMDEGQVEVLREIVCNSDTAIAELKFYYLKLLVSILETTTLTTISY